MDLVSKGGVNTAANVQAGATNSQTVGTTENTQQTIRRADNSSIQQSSDSVKAKADNVDKIVVNEIDPLLFGALIFSFILWSYFLYRLPSPEQIWKKSKQ